MGLMIGARFERAFEVVERALNRGVVINATSENNLRFVPPLILSEREVDMAVDILNSISGEID